MWIFYLLVFSMLSVGVSFFFTTAYSSGCISYCKIGRNQFLHNKTNLSKLFFKIFVFCVSTAEFVSTWSFCTTKFIPGTPAKWSFFAQHSPWASWDWSPDPVMVWYVPSEHSASCSLDVFFEENHFISLYFWGQIWSPIFFDF